jgi:hypothetical protein
MKSWRVLIQHQGKILEIIVEALYYSSARYTAEEQYPGCRVYSITEARIF